MKKKIVIISAMALISACSTSSKNISATHVSTLQYQTYDCNQLAGEIYRINERIIELGSRLDQAANNDIAIAGFGVIFWPVLFALGGTSTLEYEYAYQKGVYNAIENTSISKECPKIVVATPAPIKKRKIPVSAGF